MDYLKSACPGSLWAWILILSYPFLGANAQENWESIAPGIEIGFFKIHAYTPVGDSTITILRIDPRHWDLQVLGISETEDLEGFTAKQWSEKHDFVAAINAGMFLTDYRTHVGYMKTENHINNPQINHYRSVAAFAPSKAGLPPFRIFDLDVDTLSVIAEDYQRLVQNLRLIKRPGSNRWGVQNKRWSEAALGEDEQGRILFIFSRSPYPMQELNRILLSLPIDLVAAQHLEGGPEAQLYIRFGDWTYEAVGSYETDFYESDANKQAWPIPNVFGIVSRDER